MQFLRSIFGCGGDAKGRRAYEPPTDSQSQAEFLREVIPIFLKEDMELSNNASNSKRISGGENDSLGSSESEEEYLQRFESDDPKLFEHLKEHGYVVIKSVCSPKEIEMAKRLFWDYVKRYGLLENDPTSWTDENFGRMGVINTGILFGGIQQSPFLWFIRLLPKVKAAFATIYGTDELITSFDGGNAFRPWHSEMFAFDEHVKTSKGWFHVDQGRNMRGFKAVQGLVTLTDASPQSGGFCLIPGSHHEHDELLKVSGVGGSNFVPIDIHYPGLRKRKIMPCCKAGDMVLWDSRTIHCNTSSLVPKEEITLSKTELMRLVAYVSMAPRSLATPEVLKMRQILFQNNQGSNHWPYILPFTNVEPKEIVNDIESISSEQKSLIGCDISA